MRVILFCLSVLGLIPALLWCALLPCALPRVVVAGVLAGRVASMAAAKSFHGKLTVNVHECKDLRKKALIGQSRPTPPRRSRALYSRSCSVV